MRGILYDDELSLSLDPPYRAKYPFLETLQISEPVSDDVSVLKPRRSSRYVHGWHEREGRQSKHLTGWMYNICQRSRCMTLHTCSVWWWQSMTTHTHTHNPKLVMLHGLTYIIPFQTQLGGSSHPNNQITCSTFNLTVIHLLTYT